MNLSGPVSLCVDRPLLSLDRPFTYELPVELEAGVGSLVSVPFHRKAVKGWVLGPTDDLPRQILPVRKVHGPVRFFDDRMLDLLRWMSDRYIAPLASVIARSHPPRVVGEEAGALLPSGGSEASEASRRSGAPPARRSAAGPILISYRNGLEMLDAIAGGEGEFILRPAPTEEVACAVEAVRTCLEGGRGAIVLVPEADPVPATATAIKDAFGEPVAMFLGGDKRERYRMWLEIKAGSYDVVVGTRPAVFAPLGDLGLIYVSRESHANHREDRSPYYHVRDVALARGRLHGAAVVMSALCPSAEAVATGVPEVSPSSRVWPPVEVVQPGPEGRARRLVSLLKSSRGAFLFEPLRGYGVARVCKSCGEPAACAACGGLLRQEAGEIGCAVCGAAGRCSKCGAESFGVRRGGVERVEEWARGISSLPVRLEGEGDEPRRPAVGEVTIGGSWGVKDFGPLALDLVGILDADLSLRRPGLAARERALAVWMEAAAWASDGRVIVQTREAGDAAIQALVGGSPSRFYREELPRRAEAGFPAGCPVFRLAGKKGLEKELEGMTPVTLLSTSAGEEALCLVTLRPENVGDFGRAVRRLAADGTVARVEAEPHL